MEVPFVFLTLADVGGLSTGNLENQFEEKERENLNRTADKCGNIDQVIPGSPRMLRLVGIEASQKPEPETLPRKKREVEEGFEHGFKLAGFLKVSNEFPVKPWIFHHKQNKLSICPVDVKLLFPVGKS